MTIDVAGKTKIDPSSTSANSEEWDVESPIKASLWVILSTGQIADIKQAETLIKDQPAEFIVADKGYDSDAFVTTIAAQDASAGYPAAFQSA